MSFELYCTAFTHFNRKSTSYSSLSVLWKASLGFDSDVSLVAIQCVETDSPVKVFPLNIPLMPLDMGFSVRDRPEEPADIDFRVFVSVQDVGRPYLKFPKILCSVHWWVYYSWLCRFVPGNLFSLVCRNTSIRLSLNQILSHAATLYNKEENIIYIWDSFFHVTNLVDVNNTNIKYAL